MPRQLDITALTKTAFAPFGDVIETDGAERLIINEGTTERFHNLAGIDVSADGGVPIISIFQGQSRHQNGSGPIEIKMMERHPLGSQAFIPLHDSPYLVVVAPIQDAVGPEDLHAFLADGAQGVNYRRNLWHHPLLALEDGHRFLVIDRDGPGDNCVEHHFTSEQGNALVLV